MLEYFPQISGVFQHNLGELFQMCFLSI